MKDLTDLLAVLEFSEQMDNPAWVKHKEVVKVWAAQLKVLMESHERNRKLLKQLAELLDVEDGIRLAAVDLKWCDRVLRTATDAREALKK